MKPFKLTMRTLFRLLIIWILSPLAQAAQGNPLKEAQQLIEEGRSTQAKIDNTLSETEQIQAEYQRVLNEVQQTNINLEHQKSVRAEQEKRIASIESQLSEVSRTESRVVPLIIEMIDWLQQHLDQDLPFHREERQGRIDRLKEKTIDPQIALADLYRAVLDAYQIESEFGYTIESYQDAISFNNKMIDVQLLRVGRIGLYFLSLDGNYGGHWSSQTNSWLNASSETLQQISQGILIAKKQRPHSLLSLPLSVHYEMGAVK